MTVSCEQFANAAEDLALGFTSPPERDALVEHASRCAACGPQLAQLTTVVDALLELAPEADPPVGFEARAVAAMHPRSSTVRSDWSRRLALGAAAAVLVLVLVLTLGRGDDRPSSRAAAITGRSGADLGRVELVAAPSPKVVVLLEDDGWSGVWVCELQDDDGTWIEVGRWTADEATGGAWATSIDDGLLDATRMRITSTGGAVIATSSSLG